MVISGYHLENKMKGSSIHKGFFSRGNTVHLNWLEMLLSGPSFLHKIIYSYPTCMEMGVSQLCQGS